MANSYLLFLLYTSFQMLKSVSKALFEVHGRIPEYVVMEFSSKAILHTVEETFSTGRKMVHYGGASC